MPMRRALPVRGKRDCSTRCALSKSLGALLSIKVIAWERVLRSPSLTPLISCSGVGFFRKGNLLICSTGVYFSSETAFTALSIPPITEQAKLGSFLRGTQLGLISFSPVSGIYITSVLSLFSLRAVNQHLQQLDAAFGNIGAGAKDTCSTMLIQIIIVLSRNYAANANHDILTTAFFQFFNQSGQQGLVTCSQGGEAYHINVVIHCILCGFLRSLEQGTNVDSPAHIGKGGCQYLWPRS